MNIFCVCTAYKRGHRACLAIDKISKNIKYFTRSSEMSQLLAELNRPVHRSTISLRFFFRRHSTWKSKQLETEIPSIFFLSFCLFKREDGLGKKKWFSIFLWQRALKSPGQSHQHIEMVLSKSCLYRNRHTISTTISWLPESQAAAINADPARFEFQRLVMVFPRCGRRATRSQRDGHHTVNLASLFLVRKEPNNEQQKTKKNVEKKIDKISSFSTAILLYDYNNTSKMQSAYDSKDGKTRESVQAFHHILPICCFV